MYKSLIKYLTVSYFFLFSMNIYGNIMLDENDKLTTPLPLPYDGKMWRNHKKLSKMMTFMRSGYIRKMEGQVSVTASVKTKTELVNLLYGEDLESNVFRSICSITDADEALKDFISIDDGDSNILSIDDLNPTWEEQPYLTAREHYNDGYHKTFKYMSIVN